MPVTPYHIGPNGLVGIIFRKWLDLPVIILANVIIDVEVLFHIEKTSGVLTHWNMPHQVFHFHTLLIGGIVGAIFGAALYPARGLFAKLMGVFKIPYKPTLLKMSLTGLIGAWLHVIVDSVYHWDVQMFWPNTKYKPLWNILSKNEVKTICLATFFVTFAVYVLQLAITLKRKKTENTNEEIS